MGQSSVNQPTLFKHGIHNENSDIRCHVAPATRSVFVFQTKAALALLNRTYPEKMAMQPGVAYPTGRGIVVPWSHIPDIRRLRWNSYPWWERFDRAQSTTVKGKHAVWVASELLRLGRFPLWTPAVESERIELQIKGTDILIWGRWQIQVKCDYYAGDGPGGTGNLFLQIAEANPLKRF